MLGRIAVEALLTALLLWVHLNLVMRLAPATKGLSLLALILPPLAPFWGWRERPLRPWAALWVLFAVLFAVAVSLR